jgi:hypothetical protein
MALRAHHQLTARQQLLQRHPTVLIWRLQHAARQHQDHGQRTRHGRSELGCGTPAAAAGTASHDRSWAVRRACAQLLSGCQ